MKNIFRSILLSAVALTAGFAVSCTDPAPENGHYEGTPTISVSPASVTVPLAGGTTEAITVTTPAEWTLTIDAEDVVASTTAGNGDGVVTFEVPAVEAMRTIKVTFTATGYVSGFPITKKASLSISQTDTEVPSVDGPFVYYDNCGEAVSKVDGYWPYVDAYAGWNPTGGEGFDQSGVTYTGKNASVRNSGKTWAPVGATYATDAPYAYLQAKTDTQFVINNINIKSGVKNYTFSFTAFNQYASLIASPYTPVVAALESGKNLTVEVSVDGQNWGAIAFTTMPDGNWTYAIAPFTLPADADKLFVRFSGYKADTTTALPSSEYQYQAALRFDDFRLVEGGEGPVVDFNNAGAGGGEVVEGTIDSILAGGEGSYSLKNAWVVATYGRGCLITDASGKYILCYMGSDKTIPAVGAVVEVNGAVTTYAGLLQFGDTAVVTATGETKSVDHGTAATMTGADLDAYVSAPAVKYASFEGALAISGNYYNVTVEGASTAIGSLSYPAGEIATQLSSLNGKGIKATGYLIGVSSGKYTNMMVTAVVATGNDPEPTPEPEPLEGTFNIINSVDQVKAGQYYMAGYAEEYNNQGKITTFSPYPYHMWTGGINVSSGNSDLMTVNYSYTEGKLQLNPNLSAQDAAKGTAQLVELIAVDGKTNTYYIKYGEKYLTCTGKRAATLVDTPAEWAFSAHAKGGICLTDVANNTILGTAGATYNMLRGYVSPASSLLYGVVFFAVSDGTVTPDPTPDPEPEPEPEPEPTSGEYTTVAEFLAAAEDETTLYTLKGTITSVANTEYGNFDLTDATGTVYIYGLNSPDGTTSKYWATSGAKLGDDIVIKTVRTSYNTTPQGKNAHFVEVITPGSIAFWTFDTTSASFSAAAAEKSIALTIYNTTADVVVTSDNAQFSASYANGSLTITAAQNTSADTIKGNITVTCGTLSQVISVSQLGASTGDQTVMEATISFADKANRTSYSTSQQIWEQNGIKVTNDKGASTSDVGDYVAPARFYKSSNVTIEAPGAILSITVDCSGLDAKYTTAWGTVENGIVTISCDGTSNTYTINTLSAQARANAITVTYLK